MPTNHLPITTRFGKRVSSSHAVPVPSTCTGRASWSGFLKLGLFTVPVKAYPAVPGREELELHQLHADCGQRIRLQKFCPSHGPIEASEIVKGVLCGSDRYVVLDATELEQLRPTSNRVVSLEGFLDSGRIEPALFAGRSFRLLPDGTVARRPYAILAQALQKRLKWAVGGATLSGRRTAVVIRSSERGLSLDVLHDPTQLHGTGEDEPTVVTEEELGLAEQLIDEAPPRNPVVGLPRRHG